MKCFYFLEASWIYTQLFIFMINLSNIIAITDNNLDKE